MPHLRGCSEGQPAVVTNRWRILVGGCAPGGSPEDRAVTVAGDRVRGPRRIAPNRAGSGVTGGYNRAPVSLREHGAESSLRLVVVRKSWAKPPRGLARAVGD